jgi:hypothetical protein
MFQRQIISNWICTKWANLANTQGAKALLKNLGPRTCEWICLYSDRVSMKIIILSLLVSFQAFASDSVPFFSLDGFQVNSNGTVLSDSSWSNDKNIYSSKDRTDKVEIKKESGILSQITAVRGISTAGGVSVFAQVDSYSFNKEGSVDSLTYCVGSEYDCISVNKKNCDQLVKINGLSSGKELWEKEKACASLKASKGKLRDQVLQDGLDKGKQIAPTIYKLAPNKYKNNYRAFFENKESPYVTQDPLSESVSGMCWAAFWSREKAPANNIAKPEAVKKSGKPGAR